MQSQEIVPIFQHYPEDATLFHTKRGEWWKEAYTAELQTTVYDAITALNLDKPWNEIHDHPVQEALANSIWSTVLACNGPQLDASTLLSLNKERFGSGYVEQTDGSHFTSNHLSISAMVKPIDDVNDGDIGVTMIHHIPTFATDVQGKPTIGDISPITLTKQEDIFVLSLITPQGNVWQKKLHSMNIIGTTAAELTL